MIDLGVTMIFDRVSKLVQKSRLSLNNEFKNEKSHYLRKFVALQISDRILVYWRVHIKTQKFSIFKDIRRDFKNVLDVGGGLGLITSQIPSNKKIKSLTLTDSSGIVDLPRYNLKVFLKDSWLRLFWAPSDQRTDRLLVLDEENLSALAETYDMILSYSSNHWINNVDGNVIFYIQSFIFLRVLR